MSKVIKLEEIEEGFILNEPVINNYGQTLLTAGTAIKKEHINLFKTWNIRTICVKSGEDDSSLEISDELILKILEVLSKKILWKPRNQFEEELFDIGILSTANDLMKK